MDVDSRSSISALQATLAKVTHIAADAQQRENWEFVTGQTP
jgi:hypothetical protein